MYKDPSDPAASKEALNFFSWAYTRGDAMAEELDYVPLSGAEKLKIMNDWAQIKLK
jgi:phosphate transport system substrate-binding protein